jgi:hypothetical protein
MWNTFSALHSGFKIYKEKYLATTAKPQPHLKGSQQDVSWRAAGFAQLGS